MLDLSPMFLDISVKEWPQAECFRIAKNVVNNREVVNEWMALLKEVSWSWRVTTSC